MHCTLGIVLNIAVEVSFSSSYENKHSHLGLSSFPNLVLLTTCEVPSTQISTTEYRHFWLHDLPWAMCSQIMECQIFLKPVGKIYEARHSQMISMVDYICSRPDNKIPCTQLYKSIHLFQAHCTCEQARTKASLHQEHWQCNTRCGKTPNKKYEESVTKK